MAHGRRRHEERWINCTEAHCAAQSAMTNKRMKPAEFIAKLGSSTYYNIIGRGGPTLKAYTKVSERNANLFAQLCDVPVVTIYYQGMGLVDPPLQRATDGVEHKIELHFDRNATKTFWYTPDADRNRNISRWAEERLWSISTFCVAPRVSTTYNLTVHRADALVYHQASAQRWVALEEVVQAGFPGPNVQRFMQTFQEKFPAFTGCKIAPDQVEELLIPKIGVFDNSLSAEYTFTPKLWGSTDIGRYACLAVILHINTRYILISCLVPDMTAATYEPAYFIGNAKMFDVKDRGQFVQAAQENLETVEALGVAERTSVLSLVS